MPPGCAGRHEGGYARFRFEVAGLLRPGCNTVAVRADNTGEVSAEGARLQVRTRLRNATATPQRLALRLTLRDAAGHAVLRHQQALRLPAGATDVVAASLCISRPHLWQGVHDPCLYRLAAEVMQGNAVRDAASLPVGFRHLAVDPRRGLLLNGRPYRLHGVNYFHAGRPGRGLGVGDAEIHEDLRILQELGATALRLVHFQYPQRVYERADELGLMLWTEIPLNTALHESEAFRANLRQQLLELIRQNCHHPSVAIWGLGNEVYRSDDTIRALLAGLHALAKQEDPLRFTTYAHCCAADDHPMALQTDLAAYNRYWGWYDREFADIGSWADALYAQRPDKPISLGEYGAGANVLHQQDPPQRPSPGGPWDPEQYPALFHEACARQIAARPCLWGHFVWLAPDPASAGRNEGGQPGLNDKGLVPYDRRYRKGAYFVHQAHWSAEVDTRPRGTSATPAEWVLSRLGAARHRLSSTFPICREPNLTGIKRRSEPGT